MILIWSELNRVLKMRIAVRIYEHKALLKSYFLNTFLARVVVMQVWDCSLEKSPVSDGYLCERAEYTAQVLHSYSVEH